MKFWDWCEILLVLHLVSHDISYSHRGFICAVLEGRRFMGSFMLTFGFWALWTRMESAWSVAETRNNLYTVKSLRRDECLLFPTCLCCFLYVNKCCFGLSGGEGLSFMSVHKRAENSLLQSRHFRRCEWPLGMVVVHPSISQHESRRKHWKNLAIAVVKGQLTFVPWGVLKLYLETPSLTLIVLHFWRKICSCFDQLQTPFCVLRKLMYGFRVTKKKKKFI